jgi:hypothetical protein
MLPRPHLANGIQTSTASLAIANSLCSTLPPLKTTPSALICPLRTTKDQALTKWATHTQSHLRDVALGTKTLSPGSPQRATPMLLSRKVLYWDNDPARTRASILTPTPSSRRGLVASVRRFWDATNAMGESMVIGRCPLARSLISTEAVRATRVVIRLGVQKLVRTAAGASASWIDQAGSVSGVASPAPLI